ncbi:MAG TPA: VOC family protein [Anaerolineales bacterium]|nr:VOC family protein [Anaerolineales bacterium]
MNSLPNSETRTEFSIHPATRIGTVYLRVADLESQIAFYRQMLGFQLHWREENQAGLGAGGADLLHLTEEPNLRRYRGVTGLYHFAVLFPNRRELARAIARLIALKYPNYPTDHIMTKTTYLDDPEGNGIELYCESPEDGTWTLANGQYITRRTDGSLSDGREPLDVNALLTHLKENDRLDAPIPPETRMGHIHLHVRDIDEAVGFYHGVIGFDVMGVVKSIRMAFVSAGGYHHHVGLNTWQGEGASPPPPDAAGLRHFAVELPDQKSLEEVISRVEQAGIPANQTEDGLLLYDPSQNGVLLRVVKT